MGTVADYGSYSIFSFVANHLNTIIGPSSTANAVNSETKGIEVSSLQLGSPILSDSETMPVPWISRRGFVEPSQCMGWVWEGRYSPLFESLRMALVIT